MVGVTNRSCSSSYVRTHAMARAATLEEVVVDPARRLLVLARTTPSCFTLPLAAAGPNRYAKAFIIFCAGVAQQPAHPRHNNTSDDDLRRRTSCVLGSIVVTAITHAHICGRIHKLIIIIVVVLLIFIINGLVNTNMGNPLYVAKVDFS